MNRGRQLSRDQSFARVATENQGGLEASFEAWTAEPGSWGGRVPRVMEDVGQTSESSPPPPPEISLKEWVDSSEKSPFMVPPPASLLQSVRAVLVNDHVSQAQENAQARRDDCSAHLQLDRTIDDSLPRQEIPQPWSVGPTPEWFQLPLGSRPNLGGTLVEQAIALHDSAEHSQEVQHQPFNMDTWSCPFTVSYLNVGLRHLVGSQLELVGLVRTHRPDILSGSFLETWSRLAIRSVSSRRNWKVT